MIKRLRFDDLACGDTFRMADWTEAGKPVEIRYTKTSTRKAVVASEYNPAFRDGFAVKPTTNVLVEVPDPIPPTPEEIAADEARHFNYRLGSMLHQSKSDLETFSTRFATDPLYAFEWADAAISAAARLHVATNVQAVVDSPDGGIARAKEICLEQALQGARHPHHSTSAVSNLAKEAVTAAYAELVVR